MIFHKRISKRRTYKSAKHDPVIPTRIPRKSQSGEESQSDDDGCNSKFTTENTSKRWRFALIPSLRGTRCGHQGVRLDDETTSTNG